MANTEEDAEEKTNRVMGQAPHCVWTGKTRSVKQGGIYKFVFAEEKRKANENIVIVYPPFFSPSILFLQHHRLRQICSLMSLLRRSLKTSWSWRKAIGWRIRQTRNEESFFLSPLVVTLGNNANIFRVYLESLLPHPTPVITNNSSSLKGRIELNFCCFAGSKCVLQSWVSVYGVQSSLRVVVFLNSDSLVKNENALNPPPTYNRKIYLSFQNSSSCRNRYCVLTYVIQRTETRDLQQVGVSGGPTIPKSTNIRQMV